jgi:RecA-family ATPase
MGGYVFTRDNSEELWKARDKLARQLRAHICLVSGQSKARKSGDQAGSGTNKME